MADIRPFICVRPTKEKAAKIAALPYDVYNRKEAKEAVINKPDSFLNIDRPETQFEDGIDMYSDKVYQKAADLLKEKIAEGSLIRDEDKKYYIYELTMDGRSQTGIVAVASIDDYIKGTIRKHENTREDKEKDRIRHVDTCSAQTGPIFLAYRANAVINDIIRKNKEKAPLYDFVSEDGIGHRVFEISETEDITQIQNAFASIDEIYIADGHHRAASAVKVGLKRRSEHEGYSGLEEFNYFLSVLFPDEELMIMDYNRVVKDLNGMTECEFLEEVEKYYTVQKIKEGEDIHPKKKGQLSMLLSDGWYSCDIKDEFMTKDPVKGLDVSLLQDYILDPLLGIEDPKTDKRIDFVGGIRGLKELERRCKEDAKVAFAMYPTSIHELFDVADAGLLMPPKSTWFEPKLRSGLFIHEI